MPDKKANTPQPIVKTKGIITKVAYGWDDIEAPIIAFVAAELPFVFQGVHGNAKTTVGKLIGQVYGDNTFRYFDCSKANLIAMAGFPDAKRMAAGEQAFVPNNRSLIGSDKHPVQVILLDELTRAPKEAQNLLLEVVENKSVFGIPTGHKICIATMNPETYRNAMKLDQALVDRFVAYLPVPDYREAPAEDIEAMIKINMAQEVDAKYIENIGKELKDIVEKVRAKYLSFLSNQDMQDRVSSYVAQLYDLSKAKFGNDDEAPYISGREQAAQLWRAIMALSAYYVAIKGHKEREALVEAAQEAIKYCLVTKHTMTSKFTGIIQTVHKEMKFILMVTAQGEAGKLQVAYAKSMNPQAKLNFWDLYYADVVKHCDVATMNEMLLSTLESIDNYMPRDAKKKKGAEAEMLSMRARLYGIAKRKSEFAATADQLEGALICQLVAGMNSKGVSVKDEPYKGTLTKPTIKSSDIVDLIVHLTTGNKRVPF